MRALIVLFAILFVPISEVNAQNFENAAVTYNFNGGRFGDNLINYLHAKWISYRYGIKLLYKPFPYSDKLALHRYETHFSDALAKGFKEVKFLGGDLKAPQLSSNSVLYTVPYFPNSEFERNRAGFPNFFVDYEDKAFRREIKKAVFPLIPISKIDIPSGMISVAVHIRRGGGYPQDNESEHRSFPLKFPQDSFYINEIRWLANFFEGKELYIHLFSDDKDIPALKRAFRQALKGLPLKFGCRKEGNHHASNVLEDFFSLMQFDCAIHSESNFSVCAGFVCDYMVEIQPKTFHWEGDKLIIDTSSRQVRKDKLAPKYHHLLSKKAGEIKCL